MFISSNVLDLLLLAKPAERSTLVNATADKRRPYCRAPFTVSLRFENNFDLKNSSRMLGDTLSALVIHCNPVSFDQSFRTLDTELSRYLFQGLIPTLRKCSVNVCHFRCLVIVLFERPIPPYLPGFVEHLKIVNTDSINKKKKMTTLRDRNLQLTTNDSI